MKRTVSRKDFFYEDCPICGNSISVPGKIGDIKKCPFCGSLYVVKHQSKNHKILMEYQKQAYQQLMEELRQTKSIS